jgi:hypothetical protein
MIETIKKFLSEHYLITAFVVGTGYLSATELQTASLMLPLMLLSGVAGWALERAR